MHQLAILVALHEVPTSVAREFLVPRVLGKVVLFPDPVVRMEELLGQRGLVCERRVVGLRDVSEVFSCVDALAAAAVVASFVAPDALEASVFA